MKIKVNSKADELGKFVEFLAEASIRIIYFNGIDYQGDTVSCGVCLDGTIEPTGLNIGDVITIDNVDYTLVKTFNHNIKLVRK